MGKNKKVKSIIDIVNSKISSDDILVQIAETFKVLGDKTRIKIIQCLSINEMCVGDLAILLKISSSGVSHQLRILRSMNLIKYRKEGNTSYYSLNDKHISQLFNVCLTHIKE